MCYEVHEMGAVKMIYGEDNRVGGRHDNINSLL